jgi:hypothetical protein
MDAAAPWLGSNLTPRALRRAPRPLQEDEADWIAEVRARWRQAQQQPLSVRLPADA